MTEPQERAPEVAEDGGHWSVTVSRHGESIVTMESNCLTGRDISKADEETIHTAAYQLLAFIGEHASAIDERLEPHAHTAPETCPGDNAACYAGGGDDAHWRCGTVQCGRAKTTAPVSEDVSLEATPDAMPSEAALKAARKYLDSIYGFEDPDTHTARHFDTFAADARNRALEEAAEYVLRCGMGSNGMLLAQGIRSLITPSKEGEPRGLACEHGTVGHCPVCAGYCGCERCTREKSTPTDFGRLFGARMILCDTCGNKRCPHATDHRNACTGSNDYGQPGSSYGGLHPSPEPGEAG